MTLHRDYNAYLDEMKIITILLPYSYHHGISSRFYLEGPQGEQLLEMRETVYLPTSIKYICATSVHIEIGKEYHIIDEYGGKTDLQIGAVIRTNEFDDAFYYDGDDLGVTLTNEQTIFKVWAPTATVVKLELEPANAKTSRKFDMKRQERGIWSLEIDRRLEGHRYCYHACINKEWRKALDPYTRAVTMNGEMGVIIDIETTRIPIHRLQWGGNPCDAIIYETHIRDLTIHPESGVKNKGTYLGAAEIGTVSKLGNLTGLSYIKDLGITHIEFLPFHDFEGVDEEDPNSKYNWGYNPVHFNVPEGSYSTDPNDPYRRIVELKQMISEVHSQGLGVIMDAVYNHVYIREQSVFEQLVPGYFFRHGENGLPSNGTGVGNDFASERLMGRKFILDSVRYWMEEFQLDGLRFDLMGIIDIETMNLVHKTVYHINPHALIIGEGWDLNTPIANSEKASIGNQEKIPEIGQFNDWFRDTIKGSTFNLYDRGFALGNERYREAAKQVLAGSIGIGNRQHGLFLEPKQSVNYVECHDNHTLWDKLLACEQVFLDRKHRLATSMVLLAQGIPFLHSGQEFFRTKKGVGNSYRSSDEINWLDWERKDFYLENVSYIKGIISIRQSHQAFRLPEAALIRKHMMFIHTPPPTLCYMLTNVKEFGDWDHIFVCFNPSLEEQQVKLPNVGKWRILANDKMATSKPIEIYLKQTVTLNPYSLFIAALE